MEFRIADTFAASLANLGNQDQKAIKTTVFDLQVNLASPGMSFHKLDRAQDPNFASVRVSSDRTRISFDTPQPFLPTWDFENRVGQDHKYAASTFHFD